jgi:flagellar biosynthetic protein FliO
MLMAAVRKFALASAAAIVSAGITQAQVDSTRGGSLPLPGVGSPELWPSVARLLGALVLVLVLAWVVLWVLRRALKGRWAGAGGSGVKVLERVYLAPRRSIEVVAVGRRILVLGVTDSHIGMLTELTPDDLGIDSAPGGGDMPGAVKPNSGEGTADRLWQQARRKLSGGLRSIRLPRGHTAAAN